MIASAKLVRAYVAEAFELGRFRELAERYRRRVLRAQRYSSLTSPVSEVFGGVMIVLILVVGTRLALGAGASLDPAVLITFLAVSLRLMSPIKSVSNYPAVMAAAVASAERVFEVLDLPSAEGDRPGETTAEFSERIEFRGVSFEYDAGEAVLRDVDLEVRRGQIVAIVGPSGAGKTTLVDLLPRFYEPTRGEILMDGDRIPGDRAAQRDRARQHRVRLEGCAARAGARGGARRECGRLHHAAAGRLRHTARRARDPPQRRAAAAHRHRPRTAARSAHPHSG
jgi:subfamily B ATP-binding cassette protein MsbA